MNEHAVLRHTLATFAYRLRKCLQGAPESFPDFSPGEGARSSLQVLRHLNSEMLWAGCMFVGEFENPTEVNYHAEIARLEQSMIALDQLLLDQMQPKELSLAQILQGPISDAMTHVGQLALYRGLVGSPIPRENFTKAQIRLGRLSLT